MDRQNWSLPESGSGNYRCYCNRGEFHGLQVVGLLCRILVLTLTTSFFGYSSLEGRPSEGVDWIGHQLKETQTILVEHLRDYNTADSVFDFEITTDSGLTPTVEVLQGPAEYVDGELLGTGEPGTVLLRISQEGDDDYEAADPVEVSFRVNDAVEIIESTEEYQFPLDIFSSPRVDDTIMVRVRTWPELETDTRAAQVLERVGTTWEIRGYLRLPEEDAAFFPEGLNAYPAIDGEWIALAFNSYWMDGSNQHDGQAIYIYHIDDLEEGEFTLTQVMHPPEEIPNVEGWGWKLQIAGRWMHFKYSEGGPGLNRFYRRDDTGIYEHVPNPDDSPYGNYTLSDSVLVQYQNLGAPVLVYETGDNEEPELVQSFVDGDQPFVVLSDDSAFMAIGDMQNADRYPAAGAVSIYKRNLDGLYEWEDTVYADDTTAGHNFGWGYMPDGDYMDISSDMLVVSSMRVSSDYKTVDEQYVFLRDGDTGMWYQKFRTQTSVPLSFSDTYPLEVELTPGFLTCFQRREVAMFALVGLDLEQTVQIEDLAEDVFVDSDPFILSVQSNSTGAVEFSIVSGPAEMDDEGRIVVTGSPGTVVVGIQVAGDAYYADSGLIETSFDVQKHPQAITVDEMPEEIITSNRIIEIPATASSGLAVEFEILEGTGYLIEGGIRVVVDGDFVVRVTQAGDDLYAPAEPVDVAFKATSEITVELPNDPMVFEQEYLFGEKGGIYAPQAWEEASTMGELDDVVVAVVSSGVRTTHDDLKNRLWTNANEIPDNGIDDDNNGYIDDVHGWNFYDSNANIEDTYGLGTLMSGIVAAEENNELGIAGIAPNARIMSLVVEKGADTDYLNGGKRNIHRVTTDVLEYAIQNGADIILFKWTPNLGPDADLTFTPEILDSGVFFIFAGDVTSESVFYRNLPNVLNQLSIGGELDTQRDFLLSKLGNLAGALEVAHRNKTCLSTYVLDDASYAEFDYNSDNAILAGVVALLKGAYPDDDPAMLATRLMDGARFDEGLTGLVESSGYLDAFGSMTAEPEKRRQMVKIGNQRDVNVEETTIDLGIEINSGLAPEIEILSGPVELVEDVLQTTGEEGDVVLRITQEGNEFYRPATPIEIGFTVNPAIELIQPFNVSAFDAPGFVDAYSAGFAFTGDIMVQAKEENLDEQDLRSAVIRQFVEGTWEDAGYLNLPEADLGNFTDRFISEAHCAGDWIAIGLDASYQDGADRATAQAIYLYQILDRESFEAELTQIIRPPEPADNISYFATGTQMAGRWLSLEFLVSNSYPYTYQLYRRDDAGQYQLLDFEFPHDMVQVYLTEDYIVADPAHVGDPLEVYKLGENEQPEFLQYIDAPYDHYELFGNTDWLMLGKPNYSDTYPESGAIHLYKRGEDEQYSFHQTLFPDDAQAHLQFGSGGNSNQLVAIDGDILAVSTPRPGSPDYFGDKTYVFVLDDETGLWQQQYRTYAVEAGIAWADNVYNVALHEGWLTCWESDHILDYNLNNPQQLPQNLYLVSGAETLYVDADPIEIATQSDTDTEVELSVFSGPAHLEDGLLVLSGEPGEVIVEAQQPGTWLYAPSSVERRTISIVKHLQELTVENLPDLIYQEADYLPIIASSSSGLPVTISILQGDGTVVDGGIRVESSGDFEITVQQLGDWRFLPTDPVTLQFTARPGWRIEFDDWTEALGWTGEEAEPMADPDGDGYSLLETYFLGGQPELGIPVATPTLEISRRYYTVELRFRYIENGPSLILQRAVGSAEGPWETVREITDPEYIEEEGLHGYQILLQRVDDPVFLRLVVEP